MWTGVLLALWDDSAARGLEVRNPTGFCRFGVVGSQFSLLELAALFFRLNGVNDCVRHFKVDVGAWLDASSTSCCQSCFLTLSFGDGSSAMGWNSRSTSTHPSRAVPMTHGSSLSSLPSATLELSMLALRIVSLTRCFNSAFLPVTGTPSFLHAFFKLPSFFLSSCSRKGSPIGDEGEAGTAAFLASRGDRRLRFTFVGVGSYSLSSSSAAPASTNESSLSNSSES
mmetsp:Transcript_32942/g.70138  ORF Transcript_32942/g.70138 Transcript_32942/m.70138 type:complete len:226 (-) Transcript_32942:3636-4313(-)